MTRLGIGLTVLACTLASPALEAHHSTRNLYDHDREIVVVGKVVEWRFINPHPYLIVEAEADDGTLELWDISYGGAAVVHLKRLGYAADTFKPGDVIVVRGRPALAEGVHGVLVQGVHPTWQDGTPVVKGGSMF